MLLKLMSHFLLRDRGLHRYVQLYLSCFSFLTAVAVVGVDQVELFELLQEVAEPACAQFLLVVCFAEILVSVIDCSGLEGCLGLVLGCEFCHSLEEQFVMGCEVIE